VAVEVPVTPPDKLAAARERMRVRRAIARTDTPEGARLRHLRREANEAFRDDIREMLDAAIAAVPTFRPRFSTSTMYAASGSSA
jgi:hypothetical protein